MYESDFRGVKTSSDSDKKRSIQMDIKRENELLRAFVKGVMRKKGLQFQKDLALRDLGREVKEFNETAGLSVPLTVSEFCELYSQIMKELVKEYFASIEAKIGKKSDACVYDNELAKHLKGPLPPVSVI